MPHLPIHAISIVFLVLSVVFSAIAVLLARAQLVRVTALSSGQTHSLAKKIARLPEAERLSELRRKAPSGSIEWRIADEALGVDASNRAAVVDSVLAEVALELEARAMWPRAAARIAGASGVLLMALELALRLDVVVAVILLLVGLFSAIVCLTIDRRASAISLELRRSIDALVDALELRGSADVGRRQTSSVSIPRRSRRR
ncbi:MAG: hypothetical protein IPM54_38155 [Polyangiaceae bacterium]|nr:hypothetical protein [Polyangiaceae bacterium]